MHDLFTTTRPWLTLFPNCSIGNVPNSASRFGPKRPISSMKMKFFARQVFSILGAALRVADASPCDLQAPQTFDGTCNNVNNPSWGAAFELYTRGAEGAEYDDGIKEPVLNRPQPREVSNIVGTEDSSTAEEDPVPHNMMSVMFGQFINHDFESNDREKLFVQPIQDPTVFAKDLVIEDPNDDLCFIRPGPPLRCNPQNGPFYIQYRPSNGVISQETSQFEVTNRVTSYLDLGTVYGGNAPNATVLRPNSEGKLLTEDYTGELPSPLPAFPFNFRGLPPSRAKTGLNTDTLNTRYLDEEILTAGDFRVNNNVALAAFHTLFMREHNKLADEYLEDNPSASDEEIFQAARRRNIAQYQKIVLEDYFPVEFGSYFSGLAGHYTGYDPTIDATTRTAFASAAFRYGHSAIRGYEALDECGVNSVATIPPFLPPQSELPNIGQTGGPFNILGLLSISGGFEHIIRGLLATRTRPIDTKVDDGIRNIGIPGIRKTLGIDVYALDMIRARLNGVPNYDRLRQTHHPEGSMYGSPGCGVGLEDLDDRDDSLSCFVRMVSGVSPDKASQEEVDLASALRDLYGKIKRVDPLIGMLAEPHVPGSSFGETLGRIVADQYARARGGDRFWYENVYSPVEQHQIKQVTLKTILERNFNLAALPDEVFTAPESFPVAPDCR